jgi:hypothetical protein
LGGDPLLFLAYINDMTETALEDTDGLLYSDTPAKAEILNNQFHSIYTKEDFDNLPSKGPSPHPRDSPFKYYALLSVLLERTNPSVVFGVDVIVF